MGRGKSLKRCGSSGKFLGTHSNTSLYSKVYATNSSNLKEPELTNEGAVV